MEPCKALPPSADGDEDLAIDIANMKCLGKLRQQVAGWQAYYKAISGG